MRAPSVYTRTLINVDKSLLKMAWGLPKLPGLTFSDPTKTQFHMKSSLRYYQGHRFPDTHLRGPGATDTDVDSNAFALPDDSVKFRCLNFTAFFKQPVYDNPDENYRVRVVNLVYFLEDDSLTVMEPRVNRGMIPKNDKGEFWHWKDFDNGKDICIYGKVFHTVSCDLFTKEWLESQGIELSKPEDLPIDAYTEKEHWKKIPPPRRKVGRIDRLRRFLEYDGKLLSFNVVWDNRDSENGELEDFKLLYFLQDDTIAIKRSRLPKKWKEKPVSFPSTVLETTEEEVTEYYAPKDLIVGQTIFVLGRRFLLCDCDPFTRLYYRSMLNIEQPPAVVSYPPHIGIGTPEDSLQSCFRLLPIAPHKDVIKYTLNAGKNLRYLCELEWIHPEDNGRRFVMSYSLADGTIKIGGIPRRNSGINEGKFLKIIGCDLFVYRYMSANPEKFPQEVIDNVRNYHMREGNLKDELEVNYIGIHSVNEGNIMYKCNV
ncbi:putative EF-hand domain-containing protein, partial [Operophtera brumata]